MAEDNDSFRTYTGLAKTHIDQVDEVQELKQPELEPTGDEPVDEEPKAPAKKTAAKKAAAPKKEK